MNDTQRAIIKTLDRISLSIDALSDAQALRLGNMEVVTLQLAKTIEQLSLSNTRLTEQLAAINEAMVALCDLQISATEKLAWDVGSIRTTQIG